jgi:putative spermidine/putrescine transport system substrate-binding protein
MKRWVKLLATVMTLAVIAGCGSAGSKSGASSQSGTSTSSKKEKTKLVFLGYTAPVKENFVKAVIEPFMAANPDIEVEYQEGENSSKMLATVRTQKDDPQVDIVMMDSAIADIGNKEGLFQALDPAKVPNLADLYPQAKTHDNFGPAVTFDNLVIVYHKDKVTTPMTSWKDLWRPELKGHVWLPNPPDIQALSLIVLTARMHGGNETNVDPAFAELKKLAPSVAQWGPAATAVQQGLTQGELWAGVFWNARAQLFQKSGAPVIVSLPKEGSVFQINTLNLVKGSKKAEAAQKFINYAISPEAQAAFSSAMYYAPVNAKTQLRSEVLERTASGTDQRAKLLVLDMDYIVTVRDGWGERWKKELIGN